LGSAEVVGLMCLKIFVRGNESEYARLKAPAMKLGAAFQKINFLRDLRADFHELGRTYFPGVDLAQFNAIVKKEIEKEIASDFHEGYLGIKSSFVRTPKFNVAKKDEFTGNKYDKKSLSIINIAEGILMVVFGFTAVNRAIYGDLGMVPFHLMLTIGYAVIFFNTLKENRGQQA
jgi:hypothetical protein